MLRVNPLCEVFELRNSFPDVAQDMSSRSERAMVDRNPRDPFVPAFERREVPSTQQSQRRVAADKRRTYRKQHIGKCIDTIYTLVNGVTGLVDGNISPETLPSLNALLN